METGEIMNLGSGFVNRVLCAYFRIYYSYHVSSF